MALLVTGNPVVHFAYWCPISHCTNYGMMGTVGGNTSRWAPDYAQIDGKRSEKIKIKRGEEERENKDQEVWPSPMIRARL